MRNKLTIRLGKAGVLMILALTLLWSALAMPVYFTSVDSRTLGALTKGSKTANDLGYQYLDNAKPACAQMISMSTGNNEDIDRLAKEALNEHKNWLVSGGDEPFFEAFCVSDKRKYAGRIPSIYEILSVADTRKAMDEFLAQSNMLAVKKLLDLRNLNTITMPAAFTSTGGPFEAAVLITALGVQCGDFSPEFKDHLRNLTADISGNAQNIEIFEHYSIGLLTFAKDLDWGTMRSLLVRFSEPLDVYRAALIYRNAPNAVLKKTFCAAILMTNDSKKIVEYLSGDDDEKRWKDFQFAYLCSENSLKYLLDCKLGIHKDSRAEILVSKFVDGAKNSLAKFAAQERGALISLKILFAILGCYVFIEALVNLFGKRESTWGKKLLLARRLFEASICALAFFLAFDIEAFKVKLGGGSPPPDIVFAFKSAIDTLKEESMSLNTDTATLAAIGIFLVLQFAVYCFCLYRLAGIKRQDIPASLKLKLLENEDNLFDLGLYIGLSGTVASLILLTFGILSASLMAGYTSTLFGIIFTALLKIVHLRTYKHKLLIEAAREK